MSFTIKIVELSLTLFLFVGIQVGCHSVIPYDLTHLNPIEVAALGRVAKLGEFYDVRTEQFLRLPIFKSSLPNNSIELTENQATSLKYTLTNTFEEKFNIMDISAEMKISVMGGLVSLKGSGRFFKDKKTSAKSAKSSLVQSFSVRQVSILDSSLQSIINLELMQKIDATHLVVGIQWGGSVFISVEDSNEENLDTQQIEGELGAAMEKLQSVVSSLSVDGKVNLTEEELGKFNKYSFTIDGDLVPKKVPQTVLDALEFMKESPGLLFEANNGKGKPIKYVLLPLEGLRKFWNIEAEIANFVNHIDEVTVKKCVTLFDEMNAESQKINDIDTEISRYNKYLSEKIVQEMGDLTDDFESFNTELTSNLSQLLVKVRSGNESISEIRKILQEASTHRNLWQKSNDPTLTRVVREVRFIEALHNQKVLIFDREELLDRLLWKNYNKDVYMLFFDYNNDIMSDKALLMFKFIIDKQNSDSTDLLVATNYEFVSENKEIAKWNKTNKICVYRNGEMVVDNYPFGNRSNETLDPSSWSLKQIQKHVEDLEKRVNQNPGIPEGFIYVQLPHQPEPSDLWKGTKWTEISSEYAGLFFRTVGGEAAPFSQTQEGFAPSNQILKYRSTDGYGEHGPGFYNKRDRPFEPNGWSEYISVGYTSRDAEPHIYEFVRFYSETKSGEVRPKNTAVRIWKRVI